MRGIATIPQTLNPYTYALNNPILYTDPSGEIIPLLIFAFVGLAGGALGGLGYYGLETWLGGDPCASWDWGEAAFWGSTGGILGIPLGIGAGWLGGLAGWWSPLLSSSGSIASKAAEEINSWPDPWGGRQIIHGIEYTVHALERMMPIGGGRGIPPSVVENAIRFGETSPGREPGTIVHIYENVVVITDAMNRLVLTVYQKTGH